MRKFICTAALSLALTGIGTAAYAAPDASAIKSCEEAYKNGWVLTNEQVAQCVSAGFNKFTEPVVVTNPGGQVPPGQQP
jgi:hypothetical protein